MFLVLFSSLIGLSAASPIANFWLNPVASLPVLSNQYHAQDGSGSYRYGYTGPHHAKMETRSNGVTQGGYSYVDANGILQTVAYTADAENGFRVRASNLPQQPSTSPSESLQLPVSETPEVAAARRKHLEEFQRIENNIGAEQSSSQFQQFAPNNIVGDRGHNQVQRDTNEIEAIGENSREATLKNPFVLSGVEASRIEIPRPDPSLLEKKNEQSYSRYQNQDSANAIPLPNIHRSSYVVPVVPYRLLHSSLHHTQDSLGQYDYSYVGDTSSKTESRSLDGTTRGAYSYVDANGLLQQVHYIADHNGFRVLATNLPEA